MKNKVILVLERNDPARLKIGKWRLKEMPSGIVFETLKRKSDAVKGCEKYIASFKGKWEWVLIEHKIISFSPPAHNNQITK
jgi:hypothetical protein